MKLVNLQEIIEIHLLEIIFCILRCLILSLSSVYTFILI